MSHSAAMSSLIITLSLCNFYSTFDCVGPLRIYGDLMEVERSLRCCLVTRCFSGASVLLFWCGRRLLSFDEVSKLNPGILPSADLLICATFTVLAELPDDPILGCKFCMKTLRTRIWLLLPLSLVIHLCPVDEAVFIALTNFLDLLRCCLIVVV